VPVSVEQGFQEFYRAEFKSLWGFAYFLCGDWGEAEELAQDAMVRTYNAWGRIRDRERPELYARAIVVNLQRSVFRRGLKFRKAAPRLVQAATAPPAGDDRMLMWHALEACSPRQRQAVVLRYYEDMSEAEIARVLDCPVGTVKSLLHRGLARVRDKLGADPELTPAGGEAR